MDEKVKVTDKEADTEKTVNKETDKNTNKDTTSKAKMMEADLTDHSEQQDEAGAEEAASYLPLAADQLDLAKQYEDDVDLRGRHSSADNETADFKP